MFSRWICLISLGLPLILFGIRATPSRACPACKIAAAGMADEVTGGAGDAAPASDHETGSLDHKPMSASEMAEHDRARPCPFHLALGFDFTNAYFHRGYLQQDEGMILQPYTVLSYTLLQDDRRQLTIRPYVGMWNSFQDGPSEGSRYGHGGSPKVIKKLEKVWSDGHPGQPYRHYHIYYIDSLVGGDGQGWYEADLSGGTTVNWRAWTLDLQYHAHIFPSGPHKTVQEVGGKLSYDLMDFSDNKGAANRAFSLYPSIGVWREIKNDNGEESTYFEVGLEPAWRTRFLGTRVGFSTPVLLGASGDGFYRNTDGSDTTWGYVSVSAKLSVGLPVPTKFGQWYFNTSLTYMNLLAESTRLANGGEPNEWIGSVGISVRF